jgi:hypothetical protein
MKKILRTLIVLTVAASAACTVRDPLAGLSIDNRAFLFADTGTDAPFLGQPVDNGPLNCYPQRMSQGYALVDTANDFWLDSIRPTGVERHKILSVTTNDDGFIVKAQNGVGVNFDLQIQRKGRDEAMISWDGAPAQLYRRCAKIGG